MFSIIMLGKGLSQAKRKIFNCQFLNRTDPVGPENRLTQGCGNEYKDKMENKRKNRKEFVHIGSIVNKVFRAVRNDADADMIQVWNVWQGVVGSAVAENARPAAFKGNLLLVHVSSSPWLQQLQFLKGDIIIRLNQALKQELVKEVKFKIGPLE